MAGFSTKAIHGPGRIRDSRDALRFPVYDTAAFGFESSSAIEDSFHGRSLAPSYSRISNPTVNEFEEKINYLASGLGAIAVASGMAAISTTVLAVAGSGDSILTSKFIFGNTYSLFEHTLKPWGLSVQYADFRDLAEVKKKIHEKTRAIFLETITNPQLAVFDIPAIAKIAREKGILLILDNTAATSYLFPARDHGADVEVISSTKYISAGGTAIGGVIIDHGSYDWSRIKKFSGYHKKFGRFAFLMSLRREIYRNIGACMPPQSAFLHSLGLESLALRADKSCRNALALARFLKEEPRVRDVNYPGLPGTPYYDTAAALFPRGCGGILTFNLESKEKCFAFMDNLRLVRRATNINDNKTLATHPASTIFCEFDLEKRRELEVGEGMVRLSCGIEDIDDLKEDIAEALKKKG